MSHVRKNALLVTGSICAAVLSGCGGSSRGGATQQAQQPRQTQQATTSAQAAVPRTQRRRRSKERVHRPRPAHRPPSGSRSQSYRPTPLTSRGRAVLARAAAQAALLQVGFSRVAVHVDRSGHRVTIGIARASACAGQPGDERKLIAAVRQVAPLVVHVSVVVADSGQSLSSYLATRCGSSGVPSGTGKVVYSHTGRGVVTSPVFEIRPRRWTVDYRSGGRFLAIFVVKNGKIQRQTITTTERTTGSKAFRGRGKFRLRISGSGTWTVQVRNGA